MEKDYIENLRVVISVGGNKISQQNLNLLKVKYNLTDSEMGEMNEYCISHGIEIFDEETIETASEAVRTVMHKSKSRLTEDRIRLEKSRIIAKYIMHLAEVKVSKEVHDRGWVCGTNIGSVRECIERIIVKRFDETQMDYIIEHLPEENDEDISFQMVDDQNPKMSASINEQLNKLIPRLHINHFYSDLFDN